MYRSQLSDKVSCKVKKKMAPSGATKFEKVYVQRNKIAVFQVKFKNSRTGVG